MALTFLTETDFDMQIHADTLLAITDGNDLVVEASTIQGISEMQSYLRAKFDVVNIFNKTGSLRNPSVVMFLVDIVLYHIYSAINRAVPEVRVERYKSAIEWLKMTNKGELLPDLPLKANDTPDNDNDGSETVLLSSFPKRSNNY
jgi:hypothetical protein